MNFRGLTALVIGFGPKEIIQTMIQANAAGLHLLALLLFGTGIILLLYPKVAAVWEGWFCKERRIANPPSYKEYAVAAAIMGGLGVLAYGLSGMP